MSKTSQLRHGDKWRRRYAEATEKVSAQAAERPSGPCKQCRETRRLLVEFADAVAELVETFIEPIDQPSAGAAEPMSGPPARERLGTE